jgi:GT2 family glycosyltransferase
MDQHPVGRRIFSANLCGTDLAATARISDLSGTGLSIVIPNWNGRALLENFLPTVVESARAYEIALGLPAEIIVSDDASTDDSKQWLQTHWPDVRFEGSPHQQGFAPTANRGVLAARFSLVYLLNNDVALRTTSVPALTMHFRDSTVFAVTGNAYDFATGVLRGAGQRGRFRRGFLGVHSRFFFACPPFPKPPLITLYATGGSSLFDRDKFLALGGFEETLAPYGWEDVELSLRAWKQGFEIRYEPCSHIWHQFSSTIGSRISRRKAATIYERNRLLTHWLHLDTPGQRAAHATAIAIKLLTTPLLGRLDFWRAFVWAFARRKEIKARRAELRKTQRRTLAEVCREIEAQMSRPEVRPLEASSAPVRRYAGPEHGSGPGREAGSARRGAILG